MKPGGGGSDGAGDFSVRGLVGIDVGGNKIGPALVLARLEDVRRERRTAKGVQVELFHERTHNQLAARDGFFNTEKRGGRWGSVEGVRKEARARDEAFGGSSQGGPPAGAGFLKKQELGPILGTDETRRNDFGVVEHQKIPRGKQSRKILDEVIGEALGFPLDQEKACRVTRPGRFGGNLIGG